MALYSTNLILQGSPLPPTFVGTPQELYEAMLERTKIVSPFGFTSFVLGSVEPASNQGPWLKDGTQWWVWSDDEAGYVPLDLSASLRIAWVQETEPTTYDPPIWIQYNGTTGKLVGVWVAIGTTWSPTFPISGTSAERPASPYGLQQYYDEDISCLIWWERGAWRTVAGSPGDIKYVSWSTAAEALLYNPGWEVLGTGDSNDVSWRGRTIVQAAVDPGATPAYTIATGVGITQRAMGDKFGEETHTLTLQEIPSHKHGLTNGVALIADNASVHGESGSDAFGAEVFNQEGGDQPHNNIQPSLALWCLRKA